MGGMAAVFAATNLDLEQAVAIKVVRPALATEPEFLLRLLREARIIAQMRSNHVARVFDVGTLDEGAPFMVMELLQGTDLDALLKQRRALPVGEAIDYLLQACEAVAEAHALGIVHRDLKPANLFVTTGVDKRPFIKVLDFGLSMYAARERNTTIITQPLSVMGTPPYMAPEQLRSSHDVDSRADIWSLGVILFELLTGIAPWTGTTLIDLCISIVRDPPARIETFPAVQEAILRCLQKNPRDRYPKVAAFAAALAPFTHTAERAARILRVQPVTGLPPAPSEPSPIVFPAPMRVDTKAPTIAERARPPSEPATKRMARKRKRRPLPNMAPESVTETMPVIRDSWTLAVLVGTEAGRVFTLRSLTIKKKNGEANAAEHVFTIGRASNCDLALPDRGVSRHHANLVVSGERVVLRDNNAKNGTFVNGRRIEQQTLTGGDEIRVGPLVALRFLTNPGA
jgi:serine/threonine-protein kinase